MQDKCKERAPKYEKRDGKGTQFVPKVTRPKGPVRKLDKKTENHSETSIHLGWLFIDVRTIFSLITIYFLLNPSVYIKQYTKGPLSEEYQIIMIHKDDLACTSIFFQFAPKPATSRKYPIKGNTSIGPGVS